jgi:peptidyl-Asp metalloendopeptidase
MRLSPLQKLCGMLLASSAVTLAASSTQAASFVTVLPGATPSASLTQDSGGGALRSSYFVSVDRRALLGNAAFVEWQLPGGPLKRINITQQEVSKLGVTILTGNAASGPVGVELINAEPFKLTTKGNSVSGTLRVGTTEWRIKPVGSDQFALLEIDLSKARDMGNDVRSTAPRSTKPAAPVEQCPAFIIPPVAQVDMLIGFDGRFNLSPERMQTEAQHSTEVTNQAFADSLIPVHLNLVGVTRVDGITTNDPIGTLNQIVDPNNLTMAPFRQARESSGADIAMMWSVAGESTCGVAQSLYPTDTEAYAVAGSSPDCVYTFTHEVGHLFSAAHNIENADGTEKPYAHGLRRLPTAGESGYRTLMSYQCSGLQCPRLPYFSNPRTIDDAGRPRGECTSKDNARAIGEEGARLAAFRSPPNIVMNVGHTGAWYEPRTAGQGFDLEILPSDSLVFGGWYTYNENGDGSQRWYALSGSYAPGTRIQQLTIYRNTGGSFATPPATTGVPVGQATLSFQSCSKGTLSYHFNDGRPDGTIPLDRLTPDVSCQTIQNGGQALPHSFSATGIHEGLTANWFNQATGGQGFEIEIMPTISQAFIQWYTYAPNAAGTDQQRWYSILGPFQAGSRDMFNLPIYSNTGGQFNALPITQTVRVGYADVSFGSCTTATINYRFDNGPSGTIPLSRLTGRTSPLCTP